MNIYKIGIYVLTLIGNVAMAATEVPPSSGCRDLKPVRWEREARDSSQKEERRQWTEIVVNTILERDHKILNNLSSAADMHKFCPNFKRLPNNCQKANAIAELISQKAKYESNFDPTVVSPWEKGLGSCSKNSCQSFSLRNRQYSSKPSKENRVDCITCELKVSEGLLQLSYEDMLFNRADCEFDVQNDEELHFKIFDVSSDSWKPLSPQTVIKKSHKGHPDKSILKPETNLVCGVRIFGKLVGKKSLIAPSSGIYWSTLQSQGGRLVKITKQIADATEEFCRRLDPSTP